MNVHRVNLARLDFVPIRLAAACAVATILTRVEVDPADRACAQRSQSIGPVDTRAGAEPVGAAKHWTIATDGSAESGTSSTAPCVRITARSITFSSSRMLPRHA